MPAPHLTFACELETPALQALMTSAVIDDLKSLEAALSLGILDLSAERAEVVRRLNAAGVPLIAWLLLPKQDGYWFNLENAALAQDFYTRFREWVRLEGLSFAAVGLDIEPDIRDFAAAGNPLRTLPQWAMRFFRGPQLRRARHEYRRLIERIHADGCLVECYQLPFIADERRAHTTLIQRLTGIVDLPADREVWMLYSSLFRPRGAALLASYGPEAQAIGVGVTGGGVEAPGVPQPDPLSWDELSRDLRLAYHFTDQIFIFSLEGCVEREQMKRLKNFTWDQPMLLPESARLQIDAWRGSLWSGLWLAERLPLILAGLAALLITWKRLRRRRIA